MGQEERNEGEMGSGEWGWGVARWQTVDGSENLSLTVEGNRK